MIETLERPNRGTAVIQPAAEVVSVCTQGELSTTAVGLPDESGAQPVRVARAIAPAVRQQIIEINRTSRLIVLQSWEGFVIHVNEVEGTFRAHLHDLTNPDQHKVESAVFDLDEVEDDDRELVRPGGVFRWLIGYRDQMRGRRERISALVFRRLPAWTASDLQQAHETGTKRADALRWE